MVNKLSNLAGFLEDQSIPTWLKESLRLNRENILASLQRGEPYTLRGPNGKASPSPPTPSLHKQLSDSSRLFCVGCSLPTHPNVLFRFLLGSFVPVRVFQGLKTEEITRAVVTLLVLFAMALFLVWYVPGCASYPLPFSDTQQLRASDYTTVAGGLYSEALFKEYGQVFWYALWRTFRRQGRFVCWYYLLVAILALLLGRLSKNYGN